MTSIIAHYRSSRSKGKNRPWFIRRLVRNLHTALGGLDVKEIRTPMGRIEIVLGAAVTAAEVRERHEPRLRPRQLLAWPAACRSISMPWPTPSSSICRRAKRSAAFGCGCAAPTGLPLPSPELERDIGARVSTRAGGRSISITRLVIGVEIVPGEAFYHWANARAPAACPRAPAGSVVVLLSGGIDSPVAAWRMMRRGCQATFVHFHSVPFLSRTSQDKARRLAEVLTRYQLRSRLYLVPFGELQRQITLSVPGDLRVVVYRRLMLRIAERIARNVRARALVTGEVVGQVASQTLDNMAVIDSRGGDAGVPAAGRDGQGGDHAAGRSGSAPIEISIVPDEDCVHAVHAAPSRDTRPPVRQSRLEAGAADRGHGRRRRRRSACVEHLSYPVVK